MADARGSTGAFEPPRNRRAVGGAIVIVGGGRGSDSGKAKGADKGPVGDPARTTPTS